MSVSSKSIIVNNQNTAFVNVVCAVLVVGVILFFCFGCTAKVRKMNPNYNVHLFLMFVAADPFRHGNDPKERYVAYFFFLCGL